MMSVEYRRAYAADRGPFPRTLIAALANTGRFFRSAAGKILFLVQSNPDEFIPVTRREELRAILEGSDFFEFTGDKLTLDDWAGIWFAAYDFRVKLPSSSRRYASGPFDQAARK